MVASSVIRAQKLERIEHKHLKTENVFIKQMSSKNS